MLYRVLADCVVIAHVVFVAFVLLGGLFALRWQWAVWVHVPAVIWGTMVELFGWFCPLTPLENWLRESGGSAGYSGDFVEQYLLPLIYPAGLTRDLQLVLGCVVVAFNVLVYLLVWHRYRTRQHLKT